MCASAFECGHDVDDITWPPPFVVFEFYGPFSSYFSSERWCHSMAFPRISHNVFEGSCKPGESPKKNVWRDSHAGLQALGQLCGICIGSQSESGNALLQSSSPSSLRDRTTKQRWKPAAIPLPWHKHLLVRECMGLSSEYLQKEKKKEINKIIWKCRILLPRSIRLVLFPAGPRLELGRDRQHSICQAWHLWLFVYIGSPLQWDPSTILSDFSEALSH